VVKADEIIGSMLVTWHNLHYYQVLMQGLRDAIAVKSLAVFVADFHAMRSAGDIEPL
jgi:queuine tRNA-ribosyltransferase